VICGAGRVCPAARRKEHHPRAARQGSRWGGFGWERSATRQGLALSGRARVVRWKEARQGITPFGVGLAYLWLYQQDDCGDVIEHRGGSLHVPDHAEPRKPGRGYLPGLVPW